MLGLNYYLFYECMARNQIPYKAICSDKKGRIAPSINEIIHEIEHGSYKLMVLTMPFNPSGEIYTQAELAKLVKVLKEKNMLLLYDKCQMDEFADPFDYINVNSVIFEQNFFDSFILINSFSKTRSLAGLRIGYICAKKKIIDFISHENEYYYFNHPQVFIAPLVLDLLCKTIYSVLHSQSRISIRKIVKAFRNTIVLTCGYSYFDTYFRPLFQEEAIMKIYENLNQDVSSNYRLIYDNYTYMKDTLGDWLCDITELQGGFNACIKIKNTKCTEQMEFCSVLSKHIGATILPEAFYNGSEIRPCNTPFWLRITCAMEKSMFRKYIDSIGDFIQTYATKQME